MDHIQCPGTAAVCFPPADIMANTGAGRSFAGTPNMMLMPSERRSTDSLVAMLASCSRAGPALQASRSTGRLEDHAFVGCGQKRSFLYPASYEDSIDEAADDDCGDASGAAHYVEKKRRLSFDQVKSLERNFELENKLEPERKIQLAKELGLQPRQVAVWFQNRRARWKTKQLERDYEVLTLDYNRLKNELEAVIEEKQELQAKVQCLTGKAYAPKEESAGLAAGLDVSSCKVAVETASMHHPMSASGNDPQLNPESKADELSTKTSTRDVNLKPRTNYFPELAEAPSTTRKRKLDGSPSSPSTYSSEILDADSPRTINSELSLAQAMDRKTSVSYTTTRIIRADTGAILQQEHDVHPSVMDDHVTEDHLQFDPRVSSHQAAAAAYNARTVVKLEDQPPCTVFQEVDACNFLLTQVDEHGALPWWDWP